MYRHNPLQNSQKFEKIIVVLTQPIEYRKKPLDKRKEKAVKFKFKKYPNLIRTMMNRYKNYNDAIETIIDMEGKKEIFVIRPSIKIDIKLMEKNPEKLQEIYDLGVKDCKRKLATLKNYLNQSK